MSIHQSHYKESHWNRKFCKTKLSDILKWWQKYIPSHAATTVVLDKAKLTHIVPLAFHHTSKFHYVHWSWCPVRGHSQTTFTDFLPFLTPLPPWLTVLLDKICHVYLVMLTFDEPPSPHCCQRSFWMTLCLSGGRPHSKIAKLL